MVGASPVSSPPAGGLTLGMGGAALAAALALALLANGLLVAVVWFAGGQPDTPLEALAANPGVLLVGAVLNQVAFLAAIPLAARWAAEPVRELLGWHRAGPGMVGRAVVGVLGISLVADALIAGLQRLWPGGGVLAELGGALGGMPVAGRVAAVVGLTLLPALAEECLFRGLLFTAAARRWGPTAAVVVSAALFGAVHLDVWQSPAAALMGLYFGLLRLRTGSIVPGVIAHAVNNLVALGGLWVLGGPAAARPTGWVAAGLVVGWLALPRPQRAEGVTDA